MSCDCKFTGIRRNFRDMMTNAHSTVTSSDGASFHTYGACLENYDQRRAPQQPVRSTDHPDDGPMSCALYRLRRSRKWSAQRSAVVSLSTCCCSWQMEANYASNAMAATCC